MAKEVKTFTVSPSQEARIIRSYQCFGWKLINNQEVYSKDSHLERRGKAIYSVTQTKHYVKLTFERDGAKLKHYNQLRQLENEFYAIPEPKKPRELEKTGFIVGYIMFGMLAAILLLTPKPGGVIIPAIAIGGLAYWQYKNKLKMQAWKDAFNQCWAQREKVLEKTDPYQD